MWKRAGERLTDQLIGARVTYLEPAALLDLWARVRQIERQHVPGVLIEAGCALGGSAIMIARAKKRQRPLNVYDVFGTIPAPGERDGPDVHHRYHIIATGQAQGLGGDPYYGYQPNLREVVTDNFARFDRPLGAHNVSLIAGRFEETLRLDEPVAFAHIDSDWYTSVKTCLERIWPVLSPGGVIVVDDYDAWSGCRAAVDEFLAGREDCRAERQARLHLIRFQ